MATKPVRRCSDGGTCHHFCAPDECFREECCSPLPGAFPNDEWPKSEGPSGPSPNAARPGAIGTEGDGS